MYRHTCYSDIMLLKHVHDAYYTLATTRTTNQPQPQPQPQTSPLVRTLAEHRTTQSSRDSLRVGPQPIGQSNLAALQAFSWRVGLHTC